MTGSGRHRPSSLRQLLRSITPLRSVDLRRAVVRAAQETASAPRDYLDPRRARIRWHTRRLVRQHGADEWHLRLPWERPYLGYCAQWIAEDAITDALVIDCGCGVGHLLLALWDCGFRRLAGVDHDDAVIRAAHDFLSEFNVRADVVTGDAFDYLEARANLDALVTTNWHHGVRGGFERLASLAGDKLAPNGIWVSDVRVDPPSDREGFSPDAVNRIVGAAGLVVARAAHFDRRSLYLSRRPR